MELKACKVIILILKKQFSILINSSTQNYLYVHSSMYVCMHMHVYLCVYKGT